MPGVLEAFEWAEDRALEVWCDTGTVIADGAPHCVLVVLDRDGDLGVAAAVLHCIREEVDDHLRELSLIGERIWNMERDFNNRAGFTAKDDNLPKRLLSEPAQAGPAKGLVSKLPEMLPKYYAARGWDADGRLKPETRQRLGL